MQKQYLDLDTSKQVAFLSSTKYVKIKANLFNNFLANFE